MQLKNDHQIKLAYLRVDIQHAASQAERGEVIHDFKMETLLQECRREHAMHSKVTPAP